MMLVYSCSEGPATAVTAAALLILQDSFDSLFVLTISGMRIIVFASSSSCQTREM